MTLRPLLAVLLVGLTTGLSSQTRETSTTAAPENPVAAYVAAHRQTVLDEFMQFLAVPNIASDTANIQKNADALSAMLKKRGLQVRFLTVENAPPVVLAWLPPDPALRTVTFYAHYDGQPVEKANWHQDPWKPVLVNKTGGAADINDGETRLYARSASDDKAAILGMMAALDAMQSAHLPLSVNVRFLFEGEEEAGSPHLAGILAKYADTLPSDLWIICDGPTNQSGEPQVMFGSRGVLPVSITAFGANRPLHSGHYGNWAPNPIAELVNLLAKLRTTDAEITIPHFYDPVRPLTPAERTALKNTPAIDAQLKSELGLGRTEGHAPLAEQIMAPSLNLDRIEGGGTGPNPANAIPSTATAYIDFRLVPDQTPEIVKQQLEGYLRTLGYFVVSKPPTSAERQEHARVLQVMWQAGYPPQRTPIDAPVSQAFVAATRTVAGSHLVLMPTLGGSTPSFMFEQQFHKPVIGLPIANYDNNQHAANENLKLKNLWEGIELYAAIMGKLGGYWK
ncbi:MAG TPA: M20/M25/M40 family metallo-hydrolase [Candidatus Saccharimonadales bacterium]|nr:M20/M25/M40 family metallo-hydrolase [Candidatus Saccharimonadales bacterium]